MQAIKKRFGIIGVGGYIAPRHLRAIYDNGGELMCALDKHDCVGVLDRYFPNAEFFANEAEFIEYIRANGIDFLSICTPNFLHFSHIALALQNGASAICEKPLVLESKELSALEKLESSALDSSSFLCQPRVYGILQLRLHPQIQALKAQVEDELMHNPKHIYKLSLRYISARGKWYHKSWKGDVQKSGGIVCNIGVHLFDMLAFVFGDFVGNELAHYEASRASGVAHFAHAQVEWLLSICASDLAHSSYNQALRILEEDSRTLPSVRPALRIDFSQGFEDLHTASYSEILQGRGFTLSAQKQAITIIESITKQALS